MQVNERLQIVAKVGDDLAVDGVILYYATGQLSRFESEPMSKNGVVYTGEIPGFHAGTKVRYYVEARSIESHGTTAFFPAKTEFAPLTYRVPPSIAKDSSVAINELMANNTDSIADLQGGHVDWIELHNTSGDIVDLSGMYLSDSLTNLRKWPFPEQTKIAPKGYLTVWADSDNADRIELHANFKLSKNGETLMLVDTDKRDNQLLDFIKFGVQKENGAIGRSPDGTGDFKLVTITPGKPNN